MSKKSSDLLGTVVHWNHGNGYGFTRGDIHGERDIFVHVSVLNGEEPRIGNRVSYPDQHRQYP